MYQIFKKEDLREGKISIQVFLVTFDIPQCFDCFYGIGLLKIIHSNKNCHGSYINIYNFYQAHNSWKEIWYSNILFHKIIIVYYCSNSILLEKICNPWKIHWEVYQTLYRRRLKRGRRRRSRKRAKLKFDSSFQHLQNNFQPNFTDI